MTHRAEQVLDTIHDNIKGLTSTKNRAYRDYLYDIKTTPAINLIYLGEELADSRHTTTDWWLNFAIEIYVKAEGFSTTVNKIRSEITVALFADYTQGLSFVIDLEELDLEQPDTSFESEKPTVRQTMNWRIKYRRNISTPE